jgi:putative tricarboxylic transport membrane protein
LVNPEYFALAIFGLTMLASIGEGSPIKNLIAGAFGILISTIGKDFMTSIDRFTYGINELSEGNWIYSSCCRFICY